MPSEFELIARHFTRPVRHTVLGVGDDGAIVRPASGMDLLASTEILRSGPHSFPVADPKPLAGKAPA